VLATYFSGQAGGWNTGGGTVIEAGKWYHVRAQLNQSGNSYSIFLAVGSGAETPYIVNAPLGATIIGAAGNDFIMSFPFVPGNTYYIDDISMTTPAGPTPTATPSPTPGPTISYPFSANFETDPFAGGKWGSITGGGTVQWSTAQSNSPSH